MLSLKSLNPEQKKAVEYIDGPSLIVAGAGSGKTRVLTYKIAYILDQGHDPFSVLALTFTNKAANEMKNRIKELIGSKADYLWMGTFHSIFARILRTEAQHINFTNNFSIYDTEDSQSLVSNIITELNYDTDVVNPNTFRRKISYLKNQMIFPEKFRKKMMQGPLDEKFYKVYEQYQIRLLENNSMDFEDLILRPLELFKIEKIYKKYRKQFSAFLVDEFQDTNKAQYELLKMLCPSNGLISVVGDDAQSIYSWRGAEISNMLNFEKDFPKAKTFKLEQNYRSTKIIIEAAGKVIKNNPKQLEKTLWTENPAGEHITLIKCSDEKDEAYNICRLIKEEIYHHKYHLKDITVLYRTNAQSRVLEDVFRIEKIPYLIVGGIEFYKRKEVKDLIAYLKLIVNKKDEESLLRIMNFPQRGIGLTTITRMIAFARKHNVTLFETMARVFEVIDIKERIQKNVKHFRILLDKYIALKDKLAPGELTRALIEELGLIAMFKEENTIEAMQRSQNIEELVSAISQFSKDNPNGKIEDYLQQVSLMTDIEKMDGSTNAVNLMTCHSVKGLEFPVVFVTGLEEDIFPLSNRFSFEAHIEEERRLFYVSMTRAEKKLYLTHARSRYRFGEVAYQNRSRFIEEVPTEYFATNDPNAGKKTNRKSKKELYMELFGNMGYKDFTKSDSGLRPGMKVYHDTFGLGKVLNVVGTGDSLKATVMFEGNNPKNLMLKFAKLKVSE